MLPRCFILLFWHTLEVRRLSTSSWRVLTSWRTEAWPNYRLFEHGKCSVPTVSWIKTSTPTQYAEWPRGHPIRVIFSLDGVTHLHGLPTVPVAHTDPPGHPSAVVSHTPIHRDKTMSRYHSLNKEVDMDSYCLPSATCIPLLPSLCAWSNWQSVVADRWCCVHPQFTALNLISK
jgi:hypothetical protein